MKGNFSEIIRGSWEWTKTVLFRPFSLKKWLFLCIIAILAAEISGFNSNLNLNLPKEEKKEEIAEQGALTISSEAGAIGQAGVGWLSAWLIPIIIFALLIGFLFFLFFIWIYSRFSFIFLSSVANNDASIKKPFRENKFVGNSYFKWNIAYAFISVGVVILYIAILIAGLYFLRNISLIWRILLLIMPWCIGALAIFIILCIINLAARDLVLPIMFKGRMGILAGWKETLPIIKREKLNFAKYALIKIGLGFVALGAAAVFSMVVMFAMLMIFGIIFALLYSASFLLPPILQIGYYVILIILGIICFIGIMFLLNMVLLPIPVFFRTFGLKFLARLDERYDLFALNPRGGAE